MEGGARGGRPASQGEDDANSSRPQDLSESSRVVYAGVAVGLFTFVLHDMINFALFVPGAATTLFALLAFCIAERQLPPRPPLGKGGQGGVAPPTRGGATRLLGPANGWSWLPVVSFSAVAIALVGGVFLPVVRSSHHLKLGRAEQPSAGQHQDLDSEPGLLVRTADPTAQAAYRHFTAAAEADPLDPTPYLVRAQWLLNASMDPGLAEEATALALESLAAASERDPFNAKYHRLRMQIHQAKATASGSPDDYLAAVAEAKHILELYPQNPRGLVSLADCQLAAGEATHSRDLLRDAVIHYSRALELDEQRPSWEVFRRFRDDQRRTIEGNIETAQRLLDTERK